MCELEHRDNLWAGKIDHKISEISEVAAVEKVQAVSKADNWHRPPKMYINCDEATMDYLFLATRLQKWLLSVGSLAPIGA